LLSGSGPAYSSWPCLPANDFDCNRLRGERQLLAARVERTPGNSQTDSNSPRIKKRNHGEQRRGPSLAAKGHAALAALSQSACLKNVHTLFRRRFTDSYWTASVVGKLAPHSLIGRFSPHVGS